jgi:hypothetical protein
MNLTKILGRSVGFHRCLAELSGSVTSGLMLSQAVYWTGKTSDPDGWFWKTQDEWFEETMLSRKEQESARRRLRDITFENQPLWSEQLRGVPAKLFYRVDMDILECLLAADQYAQKEQSSMPKRGILESPKGAYKNARKGHTFLLAKSTTETTSESTAESTTETTEPAHAPRPLHVVEAADIDSLGDAFDEAYPGMFNQWGKLKDMRELVKRLNANASHVREFPLWLKRAYPMKANNHFAFMDLFPEFVKQSPKKATKPVTTCGKCDAGYVVNDQGLAAKCPCQSPRQAKAV